MKIRIIASSDIHGAIMPISYGTGKETDSCFLKMIRKLEEYKTENTIYVDNGDNLQGTPLLKYYYDHKEGENPVNICLNTIYDYLNIGNHDFDYGGEELLSFVEGFKGKCLCGNVFYNHKRIGEEYVIKEFDENNKIALIGCVTQYLVNYEKPENLCGFELEDCYEYCKKTIAKIKEKEDVKAIVLVYHGGFEGNGEGKLSDDSGENEGYKMCQNLDFDILISGHQHLSLSTKIGNKIVTQTAANAKEFAVIDYDLETRTGNCELIKVEGKIDEELEKRFLDLEDKTQAWLDESLGSVDRSLLVADQLEARINKHPVISFINMIQKEVTGAQLSANALFNVAIGFAKEITYRDLVSTYVYANTLVKVKIDGKTLKKYLEKNAEYFDVKDGKICVSEDYLKPVECHYNYDMVDGLDYVIKVSNPQGSRIIEMKYDDKEIKENDEFTLVINNFRYGGSGGFEFLKDLEVLQRYDEDMVTVMANYISRHKNIKVEHKENVRVMI